MGEIVVAEPGQAVSATAGDRIVVELEEIRTTGFQWQLVRTPDAVEVEDDRFTPPRSEAPGAGGTRRFVLRARSEGGGEVELELRRPWEAAPADRFRFTVGVAAHQR